MLDPWSSRSQPRAASRLCRPTRVPGTPCHGPAGGYGRHHPDRRCDRRNPVRSLRRRGRVARVCVRHSLPRRPRSTRRSSTAATRGRPRVSACWGSGSAGRTAPAELRPRLRPVGRRGLARHFHDPPPHQLPAAVVEREEPDVAGQRREQRRGSHIAAADAEAEPEQVARQEGWPTR
jgi:hypothetical protein